MILEDAVAAISNSLKQDKRVQSIFLKGSIGRGEQDEYSDIDMYCLVNEEDVEAFNRSRIQHLESYNKLLFHDDIFIVAPQILAVYENLVHVDLFTVTEHTYTEKDFIKVLYDPYNKLDKFKQNQNLKLSSVDFQDAVDDIGWFLFQYKNSSARGNDIWSVTILHQVMTHLSRVLLHKYNPNRAQLGMKTIETSLPAETVHLMKLVYENITPQKHKQAVKLICKLLSNETEWIFTEVANPGKIKPLWERMITSFH
ncbi:nucleotidyltransferase domain-containing protein [Neobacillus niacini]|uniref:nucleotidyltransferase domain-containing protein n=1 Tax=Neobacillus niacini TaxID=86668 RepID=UPI00203FF30F|nr:nucleotidyltransferase domain-containing protein [Neobacillus niacini]MCM3690830.1 nucleotidyltransferase domain-containing protein [Neobacillus niacini]